MAKRRVKGEGSVYRRKDGRVIGEYTDALGRKRYVSGKTKPEVKAILRKLLADRDEGIAFDSENLTFGAYLDKWLDALRGTLRERTWVRHEINVRHVRRIDTVLRGVHIRVPARLDGVSDLVRPVRERPRLWAEFWWNADLDRHHCVFFDDDKHSGAYRRKQTHCPACGEELHRKVLTAA